MTWSNWSTCCFCIKLRTGTITIGVLLLIIHAIEGFGGLAGVIATSQTSPYDSDEEQKVILAASGAILAFSGVWFIMDLLLMRGVSIDHPAYVLGWLYWALPIAFITLIGACVLLAYAAQSGRGVYIAVAVLVLINHMALAYWSLVVFMYYKSMKLTVHLRSVAETTHAEPAPVLGYRQSAVMMLHGVPAAALHYQERSSVSHQPRPSATPSYRPSVFYNHQQHPLGVLQEGGAAGARY